MILALSLAGYAGMTLAQSEPALRSAAEPPLRHAELPHFDGVDKNKDGLLSIEEARAVFNDLLIEDVDNDGFVSKGEAEAAIPGLRFTNDTHEDNELRVGPADYALMAEQFLYRTIDEEAP